MFFEVWVSKLKSDTHESLFVHSLFNLVVGDVGMYGANVPQIKRDSAVEYSLDACRTWSSRGAETSK